MLNKRLLRKMAYYFAGQGGTCDTYDILDMMIGEGIEATLEDASFVADIAQAEYAKLIDKSDGWEALKE